MAICCNSVFQYSNCTDNIKIGLVISQSLIRVFELFSYYDSIACVSNNLNRIGKKEKGSTRQDPAVFETI